MGQDFYSVAVPEQRQVLGLPLRPLSLGHIILLNRIKSAFVTEGVPQTYEEIAIAALICSLPYQKAVAAIDDPETPKFLRYLANRITGVNTLGVIWGWRQPRVIDLNAVCKAFVDYLHEHTKVPYYTFSEGDFKEVSAPSVQIVKVTLMREMHFTEAEILDRSWAMCLWDYVTLRAIKGEIRMENEEAINDAKAIAERLQKMVEQGALKPGGKRRG